MVQRVGGESGYPAGIQRHRPRSAANGLWNDASARHLRGLADRVDGVDAACGARQPADDRAERYLGSYMLPTLIGNIIGGVSLVSAVNHAQVMSGAGREPEVQALKSSAFRRL